MKNPNELSAASSLRGDELQLIEQKASIVVGIANSRTRLRIGILLSKYSEYQVDYISSESEIGKLIEEADLIIGAGITAYEGVLVLTIGLDLRFSPFPCIVPAGHFQPQRRPLPWLP